MKTEEGDLLTTQGLAKLLSISVNSIYRGECGVRSLPYLKLGGSIRYRRRDVEKWLEDNTRTPFNPRLVRARRSA